MKYPKVSIVVPVRSITNYLKESIPYLAKLDYPKYEVLIFTDALENYKFPSKKFKLISTKGIGNPAVKRNFALKHATGEILAFLDDDAFPPVDWLRKAVINFGDSGVCAVGGPGVTPKEEGFWEKASGEVFASFLVSAGAAYRYTPGKKMYVDDFPTVNLLVRKDDFKKIKGFHPEFWPGEDTKLCLDLTKTGKRILYDPAVEVSHHRRALFVPHLMQVSRYGMHRGQFARIFPENSRKVAYFIPSLFVAGVTVGPLLALLYSGLWYMYFGTLGVYLTLICIESLRVYVKNKDYKLTLAFAAGVVATHMTYGAYFLYGLFMRPKLRLRAIDVKRGKYLGG